MKRLIELGLVVLLMLAGGCAMAPLGPSVLVMPARNKPFQMFQKEQEECKDYAYQQIGGQAAVDKSNQNAFLKGLGAAVFGAALGGALGAGAGNAGLGAAIGGGSGATIGSVYGATSAERGAQTIQQLYDNAYLQCMYAKGNQVSN